MDTPLKGTFIEKNERQAKILSLDILEYFKNRNSHG